MLDLWWRVFVVVYVGCCLAWRPWSVRVRFRVVSELFGGGGIDNEACDGAVASKAASHKAGEAGLVGHLSFSGELSRHRRHAYSAEHSLGDHSVQQACRACPNIGRL